MIKWLLLDLACRLNGHLPFYMREGARHLIGCTRCGKEWRLG